MQLQHAVGINLRLQFKVTTHFVGVKTQSVTFDFILAWQ